MVIRFGPDGRLQSVIPGTEQEAAKQTIVKRITTAKVSGSRKSVVTTAMRKAEEQRIAKAKAEAQAKAKAEAQAQAELKRIAQERTRLIQAGAIARQKKSRDARTGQELLITEWSKGSSKIRQVENKATGEVTTTQFGVGRGGGGIRIKRSVGTTKPKVVTKTVTEEVIPPVKSNVLEKAADIYKTQKEKARELENYYKEQLRKLPKTSPKRIKWEFRAAKAQAARLSLSLYQRMAESINGLSQIPGIAETIYKDPTQIKPIAKSFWEGTKADIKQTITLYRTDKTEFVAKIGSDVILFKGVSAGLKPISKLTKKATIRLSPQFRRFKNNSLTIKTTRKSLWQDTKTIKSPPKKITIRKGTIGKGVSLAEQTKFAGKKGTIVTAQADRLVSFIRGKKVVRKPIPNEAKLKTSTKSLLKKFDDGTISKKQFYELNDKLLKETGKTLLERSLYADPSGVVRFTRLGGEIAEAKWADILRGNVTLRKPKPQIIVFQEGQIAKFPKNLRDVVKKLKAGKKLTPIERARLVKWQTKKTGKWKPVGDVEYRGGIELEVTLAPGETIRRIRKLGVTEINGVKVNIVEAKVVKLSKNTSKLLDKAKFGTIEIKEIPILRKLIKKETNINLSVRDIKGMSRNVRRRFGSKKYLDLKKRFGRTAAKRITKTVRKVTRPKKVVRKTTKKRLITKTARKKPVGKTARTKTARKKTARAIAIRKKPVGKTARAIAIRKGTTPKGKNTLRKRMVKDFRSKQLSKPIQTYYVVEKVRGKFRKLYPKPLRLNHARDFAVYSIDNKLSRTAFMIPLRKSKQIITPPKNIQGYYSKNSRKVRPYRIKYGQKKQLVNGYIEKNKYIQDTKGEKAQAKKLRRKTATTKKRKITPQQRKILLQRLAKARAAKKKK